MVVQVTEDTRKHNIAPLAGEVRILGLIGVMGERERVDRKTPYCVTFIPHSSEN